MAYSYKQPIKNVVRERILTAAVRALTTRRKTSAIVQPDELDETLDYAMPYVRDVVTRSALKEEMKVWRKGFDGHVSPRNASELRVLYLCGPEPLNDLKVLLGLGVAPQNVWAVEQGREDLQLATRELAETYPTVRLHPGDLDGLLQIYPGRFDIVYYDACGSIFAKGVLNPLITLFLQSKLEPLAVLITNFARYAEIDSPVPPISSYFRYRYDDLPAPVWRVDTLEPAELEYDDSHLQFVIKENPDPYYSDFITRFITDICRYWIPNTRALAMRAVSEHYLANRKKLKEVIEKAKAFPERPKSMKEIFQDSGPMTLSPSSYPLYSFLKDLRRLNHPFAGTLGNLKIAGQEIGGLLEQASMLHGVVNGHWEMLSRPMLEAVVLSWFDGNRRFSTDVPLPNLLINSLLGIYGHPQFPNVRKSDRLSYTAKSTKMFTDVFVLDQCRYYYDWFPTILLAPKRFESIAFQVVARCILDRIGRTDANSGSHPFRYSAVAGYHGTGFTRSHTIPPRKNLTA